MKKILSIIVFLFMFVVSTFASTDPLCFTRQEKDVVVSFKCVGTLTTVPALQYSVNGTEWCDYKLGQTINIYSNSNKVYFRANGTNKSFSSSSANYIKFTSTGMVSASGNVMSLLDPTCTQTSVPKYAFYGLFQGCEKLLSAPEMPATTLAEACYMKMFYGCTQLYTPPKLPAKTMAVNCYNGMFAGTSLALAPELPATTLAKTCYKGMFENCIVLTESPELPATTLVDGCYASMFSGCTSLNQVSAKFTNWNYSDTPSTYLWLNNVASKGSFFCAEKLDATKTGQSYVPSGWNVYQDKTISKPANCLTFTAEDDAVDVAINKNGSSWTIKEPRIYYSTNGTTWHGYPYGKYISLTNGSKVYFMAADKNSRFSQDRNNFFSFDISGKTAASGSVMSLLDNTCKQTSVPDFAFCNLFSNCKNLSSAPALPATSLGEECYYKMFYYCKELVSAPALPATSLATGCYSNMFYNCEKLTAAPVLPAMTLASNCYASMFQYCKSLYTAPALPATSLATGCYSNMFYNCENLTNAPELPAKTLVNSCYSSMFASCGNIKNITVGFTDWNSNDKATEYWLSNVSSTGILNCPSSLDDSKTGSSYIPKGWMANKAMQMTKPNNCFYISAKYGDTSICFSLNGTLISIPSIVYSTDGGNSWYGYYYGTSLRMAKANDKVYFMAKDKNATFSEWNNRYVHFSSNRDVYTKGNIMSLLDNTCKQTSVPDAAFINLFFMSSIISAPELPATTVGDNAYQQMFAQSTSLTVAPDLPATTIGEYSYLSMFEKCTNLTKAQNELPAQNLKYYSYVAMFRGCTSLTTAPYLPAKTLDYTSAYESMFEGCSRLSNVSVGLTRWDDSTDNWLKDVSPTGTFTCPATLNISTRGADTVPTGWNIVQTGEANPTIVDLAKLIDSIKKGGSSTINDVNTLKNKILKK